MTTELVPLTERLQELLCAPAFKNKFVVIHKEDVWGLFPDFHMALDLASLNLSPGEFLIVDSSQYQSVAS